MYLQVIQVRSAKKTYQYARLVQSYRRADGKPAQKVVASLGHLEDSAISALRTALKATRDGKPVVVADDVAAKVTALSVQCSLAYLDVAVVRALWDELGLAVPLQHALPRDHDDVTAADVIFALVAQRCVAPGSKQRWFPTTALPEFLRIRSERFPSAVTWSEPRFLEPGPDLPEFPSAVDQVLRSELHRCMGRLRVVPGGRLDSRPFLGGRDRPDVVGGLQEREAHLPTRPRSGGCRHAIA